MIITLDAKERCRRYRRRILDISQQVPAAHVAPAFSCLEIVDALYHDVMRPQDVFIMSKGHGCLAQYVVLEDMKWEKERECAVCGGGGFVGENNYGGVCSNCTAGYTGPRLLDDYCRSDGKLGAHPDYDPGIGIHASTGSLGHGLGIAAGQALAERMKGTDVRVYVLLSDGECQEGSTWEAAMVASNLASQNLMAIVDFNGWGGMDQMDVVHPALRPLTDKFKAFGWHAGPMVDGHDVGLDSPMLAALKWGWYTPLPTAVVCRTVKGKGVSLLEDGQPLFHYRSPDPQEYVRALFELD